MTPYDLIGKGFYVFPGDPVSKIPLVPKGVSWRAISSRDPQDVDAWVARHPGCGFGIDCGASGLFVVDDDSGKNPEAIKSLDALERAHGPLPPTFTVRTRSGGFHYYYRGHGRNSASTALGIGLDSRGDGGYVMAPGTPGYDVVDDSEIAAAPAWLLAVVGTPKERDPDRDIPVVDLDTPAALARAAAYLEMAPPAVDGEGGGYHTIRVACRIRDFGISEIACVDTIYSSTWNRRCLPPWDDWDELAKKVGNAYRYAKGRIGAASAEAAFPVYVAPEPEKPKRPLADWDAIRDREIVIEYLVHERIETPSTGLIFGDPSAGKSFLALDLALGVATGTAWQGHLARPGVAVYFAGEGRHGIYHRAKAWETYHGVRAAKGRLWVSDYRIEFANPSLAPVVEQMDAIRATGTPIALCVVDTLARHIASGSDENSAKDVGALLNLCDAIRDRYGCVVAIVHHSGKMGKDQSRGSSAIRGAMDWEMMVSASREGRKIVWTKQKESELPPTAAFALEDVDAGGNRPSAVAVPCAIPSDHGEDLPEMAGKALSVLRVAVSEGGGQSVPRGAWREAFKRSIPGPISRATLSARFRRAEEALFASGLIETKGEEVVLAERT